MPEMSGEIISARVRDFILRYISSIEQLDILQLFLNELESAWTPQELYRKVLTNIHSVEQHLKTFKAAGFVEETKTPPGAFRPLRSCELWDLAAETLQTYKELPVRVIQLIYARRPDGARGFADAFILKRTD
jgi:hypothetical protein